MIAYCDFIADRIKKALQSSIEDDVETYISEVGGIKSDLHPEGGWFVSPKKVVQVTDLNGKMYKVTVEEEIDNG